MAMENTKSCSDFEKIMADLESENLVPNVSAINQALELIARGKFPEPQLLCRLIAGLASNKDKPDHDHTAKRAVSFALKEIRMAIDRNHINMDASARSEALHAIWRCFKGMDIRCIQRDASAVRLWTFDDQLDAVRTLCTSFHLPPVNIDCKRCVSAFASLMLSPYTDVVRACADALVSFSPVIPGLAYAITRAYCLMLAQVPPLASVQISSIIAMLGRLKQFGKTMVHHPAFDGLALDVLAALANCNLDVRRNVLNLVHSPLTRNNVNDVLDFLDYKLADDDIPIEYQQMLEKAMTECHSAFPGCMVDYTKEPKYVVYDDSIDYMMAIVNPNLSFRTELVNGLLRVLRHVKSPQVCAAAVWAISYLPESPVQVDVAIDTLSCFFKNLLDRRALEKQILGDKAEDQCMLSSDYYGATARDAQGEQQKPWLMEMEELLFVRMGITRQADGSYAIASSSKSSSSSAAYLPRPLHHIDNLAFLVDSGDALLADFVKDMLSHLKDMAQLE